MTKTKYETTITIESLRNLIFVWCFYFQTLLPTFLCHVPAGASTNELLHFAEEIRKYIFGEWKSKSDFPLHKMTVPLSLYWSIYDDFTNEKDVNRLISHLNNTIDLRVKRITLKYFDHQDFVWGSSASKLIYPDILEFFDKHAQSWTSISQMARNLLTYFYRFASYGNSNYIDSW